MILLDGDRVRIEGGADVLFRELLNLRITIAEDPGLMRIDMIAMEEAVKSLENKSYKIHHRYEEKK